MGLYKVGVHKEVTIKELDNGYIIEWSREETDVEKQMMSVPYNRFKTDGAEIAKNRKELMKRLEVLL